MGEKRRLSENRQLASDVLQVLPPMSELHELLITLKDKKLTEGDKERVYRLTRELRSKAAEVSLLPTVEDELEGIDREVLCDRFIRLTRRLLPDAQVERWRMITEDEKNWGVWSRKPEPFEERFPHGIMPNPVYYRLPEMDAWLAELKRYVDDMERMLVIQEDRILELMERLEKESVGGG